MLPCVLPRVSLLFLYVETLKPLIDKIMMKYIATEEIPILEALIRLSPQSSKTTLRSWIQEKRVFIDQIPVTRSSWIVSKGQTVTISQRKKFAPEGISIVYEDRDLVVIDKPVGLLSVATHFEKEQTAHAILKQYYHPKRIFVVHRLDQETSGVMLFAFNQLACDRLKKIFENHALQRCYTAIVEGHLPTPTGTWHSYLCEDSQYVMHATDDPNTGEKAITHYQTRATSKFYSWLEITLETGRKNQIRVHCQQAGHSVVGDKKYGAKSNKIKRLALHAHLLALDHPVTHQPLRFESPVPSEFYRLVKPKI
jgi:tRNA pseudouridine32 synthase/23S rRNA pseudouridine746 synthase/23S rRNA pseudouridine1911/1915/1917 synthase